MDMTKLMALMASKKASMKKMEKTVKPQPGKNRIRLLMGWEKGQEHVWFHDFGQHFIKDAADQIQAVYVCTNATFGTPCGVCGALATAAHAVSDDVTMEVLAKAKPSRTVLVNALMLDSTEPNTPVILELKRSAFEQLLDIAEEWGGASVFDPEEGKEIIINRDGKGLNTKYTAQIGSKSYRVPPASLTKLNDLGAFVAQESEEQMRRAIGAVNAVAGLLPAPGTGGDRPLTSATRLAAPAMKSDATFDDILEEAPAKAAVKSDIALDSELDDLLSDMP